MKIITMNEVLRNRKSKDRKLSPTKTVLFGDVKHPTVPQTVEEIDAANKKAEEESGLRELATLISLGDVLGEPVSDAAVSEGLGKAETNLKTELISDSNPKGEKNAKKKGRPKKDSH